MSRRPGNPARRLVDVGSIPFVGSGQSKSRASPTLSLLLLVVGAVLIIGYCLAGSGGKISTKEALSKLEGPVSCTLELQRALPSLRKTYGESFQKVLHVGPDSCLVVLQLLKTKDIEAWGVEPYDIDDADGNCKALVSKGLVRVADIKFHLPYKSLSFSHVVVSDSFDYLSPRYLNKSFPEITRVASDGLIIFSGLPGRRKAKGTELSKFGRPAKYRTLSWWMRFFFLNGVEEDEEITKKFEQISKKMSYVPLCQIFHLKTNH